MHDEEDDPEAISYCAFCEKYGHSHTECSRLKRHLKLMADRAEVHKVFGEGRPDINVSVRRSREVQRPDGSVFRATREVDVKRRRRSPNSTVNLPEDD